MADVAAEARMPHAQLERLEAQGKLDEILRYEVLNGELVIRGSPLLRHQRAVNALMRHFDSWTRQHGGEAFAGLGVEIGPHQLGPDVTFIGPERVDALDVDGFRVPPDLVAEVTSPGSRSLDLHEKRDIYESLGVGGYWVVDLQRDVVVAPSAGAMTPSGSPSTPTAR